MIELIKVSKKFKIGYGKRKSVLSSFLNVFNSRGNKEIYALRNINLKIKNNENIAIIGPNGSGKSTLLKIICGILAPSSGKLICDKIVTPFLQFGVGFQPDLTTTDNVYLYGAILGKSRDYINGNFNNILKFAELENFVNAKLKDLSAGMQSRLAFSVAIHCDPEILILDEVLAVGDLEFTKKCMNIFNKFKKQKKTIIFVSHDLDLVNRFFDRCVYIKNGLIIADGKTKNVTALYKKHASKK